MQISNTDVSNTSESQTSRIKLLCLLLTRLATIIHKVPLAQFVTFCCKTVSVDGGLNAYKAF